MDTSGEVADLFVKEGIQITEATAKLAGLGAKNLAAIIVALLKDNNKLQGKTNMKQLLKSEKPLCIVTLRKSDLSKFNNEAKKYGVLYSAVTDNTSKTEYCDVIAKQEDISKLNYIIEKLGIVVPKSAQEKPEQEKTEEKTAPKQESGKSADNKTPKKERPRINENQRGKQSTIYGDTAAAVRNTKPSVKAKINKIRSKSKSGSVKPKQKGISR